MSLNNTLYIYSWGHSEYNQHGGRTHASSDYVDTYHYFVPRYIETLFQNLNMMMILL